MRRRRGACPACCSSPPARTCAADGLGDIACQAPLVNRDGTPRHDTPRPLLAIGKVRHVGQPVALRRRRDLGRGARRRRSDRGRVRAAAGGHRCAGTRSRRARRSFSTIFPAISSSTGTTTWATRRRPRPPSPRPRASSASISSTTASWRTRWSRATRSPTTTGKRPLDPLHGDARAAFRARPAGRGRAQDPEGQAARHHAQCRRRLRHEGLRLSRAGAGGVGEPQARAAGQVAGGPLGGVRLRQSGTRPRTRAELALDESGRFLGLARFHPRQSRRLSFAVRLRSCRRARPIWSPASTRSAPST